VTADAVSGGAISATGQHDVITVARRGSTFELWVNGALVDSTAVNAASGSLSGGKMRTGQRFAAGQNWFGSISSIMLDANYAPTEAEITALHADLAAIHSGENADFSYGRLVYDGTDDYQEAVDPDADLAITGDLTILSAFNSAKASTDTLVSSGSDNSTNSAYGARRAWSGEAELAQADAATSEIETTSTFAIPVGSDAVLSWARVGAAVTFAQDVQTVEAETFSTVTAPTAGSSPETIVGAAIGGGTSWEGSILQLAVIDRALSTGLLLHAERALGEKIE
jgi:hypothetical protein